MRVRGEYRFVESLTLLSQRLNARGGACHLHTSSPCDVVNLKISIDLLASFPAMSRVAHSCMALTALFTALDSGPCTKCPSDLRI